LYHHDTPGDPADGASAADGAVFVAIPRLHVVTPESAGAAASAPASRGPAALDALDPELPDEPVAPEPELLEGALPEAALDPCAEPAEVALPLAPTGAPGDPHAASAPSASTLAPPASARAVRGVWANTA
jgi:hypothetical protein